jgi:prepilin-type N-terminal cleavage/methylation domain-containing protein
MRRISRGFTIVELLVVISVIGILAAITIVGFNRYQTDARDAQRSSQATVISEALEKYYDKNGEYPSCPSITTDGATVVSNVLTGVQQKVLVTPKSDAGQDNSIKCQDLQTSDPDVFAYVGDGSSICSTGAACLQYSLKYKEESSGTIKTITSRRSTSLLTSGDITNLAAATYSFSQINLSWAAVGGATTYNIQWKLGSNNFTTPTGTSTSSTATASVTGLTLGTLYYFRVQPVSATGTIGNWSNVASATTYTLDTPTCTASRVPANPSTQLQCVFNSVANATSYTLEYSTINNNFASGQTTINNATSPYVVTGLAAGTTIYFRVQAVAAGFTSGWSAVVSEITQLPAPVCNTSTLNSNTSITVSWSASQGALRYNLQISTNSGFNPGGYVWDTTATSVQATGLNNGTTYYFRVQAVNGSVQSTLAACPSRATGVSGPTSAGYSYGGCCQVVCIGCVDWVGNNADGMSGNYYASHVDTYGSCEGGASFEIYMDAWYAYSNGNSANTGSAEGWTNGNRSWWMINGSDSWYAFYNGKSRCVINGQAAGGNSMGTIGGY